MSDDVVLAVDLDGTLLRSDMLLESWWDVLSHDVIAAISALTTLRRGIAPFKAALAGRAKIDVARLPYDERVLEMVRARRAAGGGTALATATDAGLATAIADHLGCFDEVHASDGTRNLKGEAKAAFLVERYGREGFDYVGDAEVDLPVWRSARRAITVAASDALRRKAEAAAVEAEHIDAAPAGRTPPWLKALRPHQWLKNILVFLPVIAAHQMTAGSWAAAVVAFITFSMVASSVYLLNDLLDLSADRAHPRKRERPMASGRLPLLQGSLMAAALFAGGLLLALLFARIEYVGVLLAYFALTTAYSLYLKRKLVIDICVLAGLYTMRVFAGGTAAGIVLSPWLLAFSIFLFLSLAAVKRQAELIGDLSDGREQASGRAYVPADLPIVSGMALSSGYVAVLVLALYLNTPDVRQLYQAPFLLWGVCPILLYWVSRTVMIAHRGRMHDDPVIFAIRDRMSQACGLLIVGIVIAGTLA